MKPWVLASMSLAVLMSLAVSVSAETYVSGMVGYTVALDTTQGSLTSPGLTGLSPGTSVSNTNLNNSPMFGMKLGHYFESMSWLGVELESFMTNPHVSQQRPRLEVPGVGSVIVQETGAMNRLVVLAPNLMARYQAGSVEPYVGVGPGIFFLHQRQATLTPGTVDYSQSSTRVGLNTQMGLRYRLTEQLAVFGEWKFNYVPFNLPGQVDGAYAGTKGIATLHHFVFGIGYHF
ncbi:MAG: outer membrane beta-barrel protein [Nitrospira sp.]